MAFIDDLKKYDEEAKVLKAKGEELKGAIEQVRAHQQAEQGYQARFEKFLNENGMPSTFTLPELMIYAVEKSK